ncbi:MAG TPA: dienelactone hydrolase family protein [Polyangia bacterium]|nr:dienelactone hydrolase family protein [Polyangia bacterium]
MPMVPLKSREGAEFQGYLALPPGGRGPGLVLLQEIFGVNQVMRDLADSYAARGFVTLCPDLFWRQQPGIQLTDKTEAEWQRAFELYKNLDESLAVADTAQAVAHLRQHPACTGPVGGVGYCLGGKLAYLLAARADVDACVGYYGVGIERALGEAPHIKKPLLLHLAGRDKFCPPEAQATLHRALDTHPQITLHDYPDQDHAFARPGGEHHHLGAAELADLRTIEFFTRHLHAARRATVDLAALWEEHTKYEFATKNTEDTLRTMVPDAYVNHVPTLTGGTGQAELRDFYSRYFIPQMPPDTQMTPVSRTIGTDRVVDEMVFTFTHSVPMAWMLPGIPPTGKRVEVALIVVIHFKDNKLAHEHIYWDQASVLVQLGLLDASKLPIAGAETARKVLDPHYPSNQLIRRTER